MPKRKRDDDETQDSGGTVSIKQRRIEQKLKIGATKLGHAFKVAKGFERQKLGRRRKTAAAQSNQSDIVRIDSEIEALKSLDTSAFAKQHLFKTLSKTKTISEHSDLPPQVNKPAKGPSDPPTLNVIARLCRANKVKAALDAAVIDIKQALGIEVENGASVKKRRRAKDFDRAESPEGVVDGGRPNSQQRPDQRPLNGSLEPPEQDGEGGDEFGPLEDRIASSSSDQEDEFSDAEELERLLLDEGARKRPSKANSNQYDVEADLSLSNSDDAGSGSASPEPQKSVASKKTSFLPSLTMGGYISGSESEAEDVDIAPKKNRRGQRARQQIWEQKYGSNAKHLQKENRNSKWDPKRGAVDGGSRNSKARLDRTRHVGHAMGGGAPKQPAKPTKHRDDSGALHPSWQAAKKAKEKKDAPVAFEGKKIRFD